MAFKCRFLAILFFVCMCIGCKSPVGRILEDVDSYIQERPDSALAVLEAMDTAAIVRPCDLAKYSLLHTMAIDKNYSDTSDVSLIAFAAKYYRNHGTADERIKAAFYEARLSRYAGNIQDAIVAGMRAKSLVDKNVDLYWKAMVNTEIGYIYSRDLSSLEELNYLKYAKDLWVQYGDSLHIQNAYSNLATAYGNNEMYIQADSVYSWLIDNFSSNTQHVINRAQNALSGEIIEPKQIVEWFESAIDNGASMTLENYYAYAYALSLIGDSGNAHSILKQLEAYNVDHHANHYLYQVAELEGDYHEAYLKMKSYMHQSDSIVRITIDQSVFKAMAVQSKLETEIAESKIKQTSILVLSVTVISILVLLLLLLLFQKRRRKLESEKDMLIRLCDESNRMLENIRIQEENAIKEVSDKLRTTEDRLLKLRTSYARMYQSQLKSIGQILDYDYSNAKQQIEIYKSKYSEWVESILNSLRYDQRNQKEFEKIINSELDNIMAKLRTDYPTFKEDDFRLLSYAIVGFDSTTCATLLDWPENRVRVYKTRLTQKIQTMNSDNIDLYMAFLTPKKQSGRKANYRR